MEEGPFSTLDARRQTAHEFVRDTLKQAILGGKLAAGTRLVQSDLAEQLDVSTTPIREALRDLASEGLVNFDPHRGAIVHELDPDELDEVSELRAVLEPLGIRKAIEHLDDDALAEMRQLHTQMGTEENLATWLDLNRRFHLIIHEATESQRLHAMLARLQDATTMYIGQAVRVHPQVIQTSNEEHGLLLESFERGDGETASEIIVQHITTPRRSLTEDDLQHRAD